MQYTSIKKITKQTKKFLKTNLKFNKNLLQRSFYAFVIFTLLPISVPDLSGFSEALADNPHGPQVIKVTETMNFGNPVETLDITDWFFWNDETDEVDNTLGSFVEGPATPPIGYGSVEMTVSGTQRRNLATYQFSGVKLGDIFEWSYSTYQPSANPGNTEYAAYMNFNVDFDGSDTWQKRLAYVPRQNGTVLQDTWQTWDLAADDAQWWWSGFAGNGNKWPDDNTNEYRSWSDLIAAFPNIAVRTTDSWVGMRVGEPYNDGFTGYVDNFTIKYTDSSAAITRNLVNIALATKKSDYVYKTFDFDPDRQAICHMPPGNPFAAHVIPADDNSWQSHLDNHDGDFLMGEDDVCPPVESLPEYCGDGEVNQEWEQCDSEEGCTEQCQWEQPNQCSDLVLARVNMDKVKNWGSGDMDEYVYLGSDSNVLPAGTWFPLYWNGIYFTDPDVATSGSEYEDVPGMAVQRLEGSVRTIMHGSTTNKDKEHVHGNVEFYNATVGDLTSDDSNDYPKNNKLEGDWSDGSGIGNYNAGDDEISKDEDQSFFWLTTTTADDGYYTDWEIIDNCEEICEPGAVELINASFEEPIVTDSKKWEIHDSVPGWTIEWESTDTSYQGASRPDDALLELHRDIFGPAADGDQYVELDTDWGVKNGEPASVRISQEVATFPGASYKLTFAFTPRPNTDVENNKIEVKATGNSAQIFDPETSSMVWKDYYYYFTATGDTTVIEFADKGNDPDSLGTFLDDVRLELTQCTLPDPICGNDIKEEGEQCDGQDGVDDGYICNQSCELEAICVPEAGWASYVEENNQGNLKNGNPVTDPNRIDPDKVLGEPDGKFFSLGQAGSVTVGFPEAVNNVDGDDISIHELTNGRSSYPEETAKVEVSQDGSTWYELPGEASSKATDGVTYFDFASTGLSWIAYVRVTDTTDFSIHASNADGFDLDAVDVTEILCETPDPEVFVGDICAYKFNDQNNNGEWDEEDFLSDWEMNLWEQIDSFTVASNVPAGADSNEVLASGEDYLVVVSGTWQNSNNTFDVDAEYISYDSWSSHQDGPALGVNQLDTQIDQSFVAWGEYNDAHTYYYEMSGSDSTVNLRMFDGNPDTNTINNSWYGDNSGSLEVVIYHKVSSGLTDGEAGYCFAELEDGDYLVSETMQDGWEPTTDVYQATSVVEASSEEVYFGNHKTTGTLTVCKYEYTGAEEFDVEDTSLPLSEWPMTIYQDEESIADDITGENGCVTFELEAGSYEVYEASYEDWTQTYPTIETGFDYHSVVVDPGSEQTVVFFNREYNDGGGEPECITNCGGGGGPTSGSGGPTGGGGPITLAFGCIEIELLPMSLNGGPITYNPGGKAKFQITITNNCSGTAHNAVVKNVLPKGFKFAGHGGFSPAAISSEGGVSIAAVNSDATEQDWNAGDVAPGASWSTTYEVDIDPSLLAGNYINIASVEIDDAVEKAFDEDEVPIELTIPEVQGYEYAEPEVQVLGYESLPETGGAMPVSRDLNPMLLLGLLSILLGSTFYLKTKKA